MNATTIPFPSAPEKPPEPDRAGGRSQSRVRTRGLARCGICHPRNRKLPPDRADIVLSDLDFSYFSDQPVLSRSQPHDSFWATCRPRRAEWGRQKHGREAPAAPLRSRLRVHSVGRSRPARLLCARHPAPLRRGVPQDPYFFATSIRENLLVMKADATDAELRAVCELANAWEFVEKMPEGLSTLIGEGGARLSGGQRAAARGRARAAPRPALHDFR